MASTASSSSAGPAGPSSSTLTLSSAAGRSQAGPLPSKRGEIGYQEGVRSPVAAPGEPNAPLPPRHPEDRSDPSAANSDPASAPSGPSATAPTAPTAEDSTAASSASSTHSAGKRSFISFLSRKKAPRVGGVRLITFARFIFQILVICATIVGWGLLAHSIAVRAQRNREAAETDETAARSQFFGSTGSVIVHVAFGIAVLAQVLLAERALFHVRAERYCHLHPGALLPRHMRRELLARGGADAAAYPALALAPWNRPPLPTYAAALADAGHGTGDAEDAEIAATAAAPPPAYGRTRGSLMLLSGPMDEQLRTQARAAAVRGSAVSHASSDRPVSYLSHDSDWDERVDADRARRLEETLSRLEDNAPLRASRESQRTIRTFPAPASSQPLPASESVIANS